jgi:hypothetical protein
MRVRAAVLLVATVLGCDRTREPTPTVHVPPPPSTAPSAVASEVPRAPTPSADVVPPLASATLRVRAGKARGPVANAAQALRAFQGAWDEEILPNPVAVSRTSDVHASARASARLVACRQGHARAKDTLGPSETDLVLFSALEALDRAGDCWEVNVPTGRFNEILGYVDPKTGALVFAWLVPEG